MVKSIIKVTTAGRTSHTAVHESGVEATGDTVNNTLLALLEKLGVIKQTGQPHPDIKTYELDIELPIGS